MEGYKIVDERGYSLVGTPPVHYVVGGNYHLPAGVTVQICNVGFHFCPVATDCMDAVGWHETYRLFKVVTLPGAQIVTTDGRKYACSGLTVVADVTGDVRTLLSNVKYFEDGVCVPRFDVAKAASWKNRATLVMTLGACHADEGPAVVHRTSTGDRITKRWRRDGRPSPGFLGYSDVAGFGGGLELLVSRDGRHYHIAVGHADYAALRAMLERTEACECNGH
jgi:hypothetical protein